MATWRSSAPRVGDSQAAKLVPTVRHVSCRPGHTLVVRSSIGDTKSLSCDTNSICCHRGPSAEAGAAAGVPEQQAAAGGTPPQQPVPQPQPQPQPQALSLQARLEALLREASGVKGGAAGARSAGELQVRAHSTHCVMCPCQCVTVCAWWLSRLSSCDG